MKYFVSVIFRLLYFFIATKGAACRELLVVNFDFYTSIQRLKARYAVSYICDISTFPFVSGQLKARHAVSYMCGISTFSVRNRATRARHAVD